MDKKYFSFLNKKAVFIIICGLLLALIFLIMGFFFWFATEESVIDEGMPLLKNTAVDAASYQIIDSADGKIIKNSAEGLTLKAPVGWEAKKYEDEIDLASSNLAFEKNGDISLKAIKENGICAFSAQIFQSQKVNPEITTYADDLAKKIEIIKTDPSWGEGDGQKSEAVKVSGKDALKNVFSKGDAIQLIEAEVPVGQRVYSFSAGFISDQKCVESFYQILLSVSISE